MKIAAEAAREFEKRRIIWSYPQDTIFGNGFRVSYAEDLSELNNGEKFYYSIRQIHHPKMHQSWFQSPDAEARR